MTEQESDLGPARDRVNPPMAALVTAAIDGTPFSEFTVDTGEVVTIHAGDRDGGTEWDEYDGADTPDPDGEEQNADAAQASTELRRPSWVTVAAGGERQARVSADVGETVSVHLAPLDESRRSSADDPEGSTGENPTTEA